MDKPTLICLTPIRNEAWILRAFLAATSTWADVIIVVDQSSDDGSRQIASSFPKVKLIENPYPKLYESKTRELLFKEANRIEGPKIVLSLDADEFLSGDFKQTVGWNKIVNSKAGDVFTFRWINLCGSYEKAEFSPTFMEWGCHYDDRIEGNYPDAFNHALRLPLPPNGNWVEIDDIYFIHFAGLNLKRQLHKQIFYQFTHLYNDPAKSLISLHRTYFPINKAGKCVELDNSHYSYYLRMGFNLVEYVNLSDEGGFYLTEINRMLEEKGASYFKKLDCWSVVRKWNESSKDPRSYNIRFIHAYLRLTSRCKHFILIRLIDKVLKLYI